MFAHYRLLIAMATPTQRQRDTMGLPRRLVRELAPTGIVTVDRRTLAERASARAGELSPVLISVAFPSLV